MIFSLLRFQLPGSCNPKLEPQCTVPMTPQETGEVIRTSVKYTDLEGKLSSGENSIGRAKVRELDGAPKPACCQIIHRRSSIKSVDKVKQLRVTDLRPSAQGFLLLTG